jgi:hypothetical protein
MKFSLKLTLVFLFPRLLILEVQEQDSLKENIIEEEKQFRIRAFCEQAFSQSYNTGLN